MILTGEIAQKNLQLTKQNQTLMGFLPVED